MTPKRQIKRRDKSTSDQIPKNTATSLLFSKNSTSSPPQLSMRDKAHSPESASHRVPSPAKSLMAPSKHQPFSQGSKGFIISWIWGLLWRPPAYILSALLGKIDFQFWMGGMFLMVIILACFNYMTISMRQMVPCISYGGEILKHLGFCQLPLSPFICSCQHTSSTSKPIELNKFLDLSNNAADDVAHFNVPPASSIIKYKLAFQTYSMVVEETQELYLGPDMTDLLNEVVGTAQIAADDIATLDVKARSMVDNLVIYWSSVMRSLSTNRQSWRDQRLDSIQIYKEILADIQGELDQCIVAATDTKQALEMLDGKLYSLGHLMVKSRFHHTQKEESFKNRHIFETMFDWLSGGQNALSQKVQQQTLTLLQEGSQIRELASKSVNFILIKLKHYKSDLDLLRASVLKAGLVSKDMENQLRILHAGLERLQQTKWAIHKQSMEKRQSMYQLIEP